LGSMCSTNQKVFFSGKKVAFIRVHLNWQMCTLIKVGVRLV